MADDNARDSAPEPDAEPADVLRELAAALHRTALLDCPFALAPPPARPYRSELAARERELAKLQPALPW
jgi:hypothetical protein